MKKILVLICGVVCIKWGPYLKFEWTGNKIKSLVDLQNIFITKIYALLTQLDVYVVLL